MIYLTHNGKTYPLRADWADLTLTDAIRIADVDMPEITDDFDWYEHQDVMIKVMSVLSPLDWSQINPVEVQAYFIRYGHTILSDLHSDYPTSVVPQLIKDFEHKGQKYLMPTSLVINDDVVLQHGQTVKPFIEASNLLKRYSELRRDGIRAMNLFCASVVKEQEGEQWDERVIVDRAERFKDLPMSIVWEVFFCISALTHKSVNDTLQFMIRERQPKTLKQRLVSKLGDFRLRRAALWAELKRLKR